MDWSKATVRRDKKHLSFGSGCSLYWRFDGNSSTHCGQYMPYGTIELRQHWIKWWLVACWLKMYLKAVWNEHWFLENVSDGNLPVGPLGFNTLAPRKFEWNLRHVIFKQILVIDGWGISYEIALIWMSLDFTDDQPTLVQVMVWCRQATNHYLSQCWPRSLSPYGITRPH